MQSKLKATVRGLIVCSVLVLVTACGTGVRNVEDPASRQTSCGVFSVLSSGEPLGTAFSTIESGRSFLVSAAHVVKGVDSKRLSLRSICSKNDLSISDILFVPGNDLAILLATSSGPLPGFTIRDTSPVWGELIVVPNFGNLSKASVRLAGAEIPSSGRVIKTEGGQILFSLDIVQKGSSGAPILDGRGQVLGLLTNRTLIEGTYAGVSLGIDGAALRDALKRLPISR